MRRSLGRLKVSPRVLVLWMSGQAESPVEVFLAAVDLIMERYKTQAV
jgi:hypothetical protein